MKPTIRIALLTGACAGALGVLPAWAQLDGPVEFTTTFPFTVERTTLPPGRYEIRPLDEDPLVYRISSRDGRHGTFFSATPTGAANGTNSEVVFKETEGRYVLENVEISGESGIAASSVNPDVQRASITSGSREHRVKAAHHHGGRPGK